MPDLRHKFLAHKLMEGFGFSDEDAAKEAEINACLESDDNAATVDAFFTLAGPPKLLFYYQIPEAVNDEGDMVPTSGAPVLFMTVGDTERQAGTAVYFIRTATKADVKDSTVEQDVVTGALHGAPLDVGPILRERLFARDASVILTGATLSHEGSFERITSSIGLDDTGELSLGSPFDYRQAALIAVPEDIAEPGGTGYAQDTAAAIGAVAMGVRGRTLALFTSNSALENARRALAESLSSLGIKVIGQGHDGSPQRIMQALAAETDIVALGVSSLWEGADLQGAGLDALVMARLPFPVPSDPVFSARSELFEDGFGEYAVPEAVLRFRQGFGRLIRSKTDRGIFVILDRRILTKGYGRSFQKALPKATVRRTLISELESLARNWKNGEEV